MRHFFLFLSCFPLMIFSQDQPLLRREAGTDRLQLTTDGATHLAELALGCIQQEYPNKLSHVMNDGSEVRSPRALHPAFYGCFDWHSSVHGHWMLVQLLRQYPEMAKADEIMLRLGETLSAANIQAEVDYLAQPSRGSFERMYGWAWLLKLAEALHTWDHPQARQWSANLQPLAQAIVARYLDFLPRQTYPIRSGEHSNTAFGLSFAWDYAVAMEQQALQAMIRARAVAYYGFDADCPAGWEPSGADFLSPCLEEAALMQRVLSPRAFADWYGRFLPDLPASLRQPALVTDRSDGKLVHLDGLNLSRAWCLQQVATALPSDDPRGQVLRQVAAAHIEATLPHLASGNYEGEHWLGSFAVYALSQPLSQ
jgi:hypothetical protein